MGSVDAKYTCERVPPTALIAGSNQILVGVLRAIRELKVNVPDDVSLVTCDDVPLAELLEPPITTITRDNEAIGRLAAQLLGLRLHALGEPQRELRIALRRQGAVTPSWRGTVEGAVTPVKQVPSPGCRQG